MITNSNKILLKAIGKVPLEIKNELFRWLFVSASSFVALHWKCCNKMKNINISFNGK